MDSLFHFVFAFIAGMAVNVKLEHTPFWVALVALAAVLIDIDHFLFAYPRTFHTVFVTVLLPLLLFYVAYRYENGTDSIRYQSLSLLLLVMLTGHAVADMFTGPGIALFFPVSDVVVAVPASWTLAVPEGAIISPDGIALALYGVIIGLAYYAEEFIYFFEKRHETVENALRDALAA